MLGFGMSEILIILIVALVVIGPKRLPEVAKALGKGYGEFKRATSGIRETFVSASENAQVMRRDFSIRTPGNIVEENSNKQDTEQKEQSHDC